MIMRLFSALILLAFSLTAAAQSTGKTFSKGFNADGMTTVTLDLPGEIDLKMWDSPSVRIEIAVSLPSGNTGMLNELANVGRYNLSSKTTGSALLIQAPNLNKVVRVKGEEVKETVTFVVFVPKGMEVVLPNPSPVAMNKR